jgi:hypothetical protein
MGCDCDSSANRDRGDYHWAKGRTSMITLNLSANDLQNIMVALNAMIETPGRLNWDEKRELIQLGDRLMIQSQNQVRKGEPSEGILQEEGNNATKTNAN